MKANLRINFKRICFDAVISRQPTTASRQPGKEKKKEPFAIWAAAAEPSSQRPTEPATHRAAEPLSWPVLISVNSPAGRHLRVVIIAVH